MLCLMWAWGGMVKTAMIQCASAYWDNKLIFSSFLNFFKLVLEFHSITLHHSSIVIFEFEMCAHNAISTFYIMSRIA